MDELETRIAALEALFVAVAPWPDGSVLEDAARDLRAGLAANIAGDERTIRLQALSPIEDAQKRFKGLT